MSRIAVVHLVRHANGPEVFDQFLDAYRRVDAGAGHELVLILKGFPDAAAAAGPRAVEEVAGIVEVPDDGLDLGAYLAAASAVPHDRLCFTNSHAEPLVDGWLARLTEALDEPGVAAAGATGSWGSHLSWSRWQAGLPDRYGALGDRGQARRTLHEVRGERYGGDLAHWMLSVVNAVRSTPAMQRFPAPHLRTNAFVMRREEFLGLRRGSLRSKRGTYRLESGRRSLTAQLLAAGRRVVVADRHGVARDWPEWDLPAVFWQEHQQDLLVGDNQTRAYSEGSSEERRVLSGYAWADRARPA
jgi:hypothetical protein